MWHRNRGSLVEFRTVDAVKSFSSHLSAPDPETLMVTDRNLRLMPEDSNLICNGPRRTVGFAPVEAQIGLAA